MQEKAERKWWIKLLRGATLTLASFCLLLGAFLWWLFGTSSGARWLIGSALPYAQQHLPDTLQLGIEGVEANTVADLHIQHLTLADNEGVWFEGNRIHLAWHPAALLRGDVHIDDLSAQRLHYVRPPVEAGTEKISLQEQVASLRETLRQLPEMLSGEALPPLRLNRLAISELSMNNTVYALSGSIDLIQRPIQLNLALESVEGVETTAKIALDGNARTSAIAAQWHEASGGLLGTLLALQPPAPLHAEIASSFQGNTLTAGLQSTAGDKPLLTGQIKLPLVAEGTVSANLQLANPTLLAPLADFSYPIHLAATLTDNALNLELATEQALSLHQATLRSHLEFADANEMHLSAKAHAQREDGEPFELLLEGALEDEMLGVTRLLAAAPDTTAQATGELDLNDGDARLSGIVSIPQLNARFEGEGSDLFGKPQARLHIVLENLRTSLPTPFDTVMTTPLALTAHTQENDKAWPDIALKVESSHINGNGMIYPNAVDAQAVAEGKLKITGLPFPLILTAKHSASGAGHLRAASRTLLAETGYRLESHFLHLENLHLEAGKAIRLAGEAVVDTETMLAEGTLNGNVTSTQPLLDLGLKVPLIAASDGSVGLSLTHPAREQQVALTFSGNKMTLDGKPLTDKAILKAHATLLEDTGIRIAATAEVLGLNYPAGWDEIKLSADGSASLLKWSLNAKNKSPAATLSANGDLRLAESIVLLLNSLNAQWQENRLKLQKPAELSYAPDKITLSGLDLRLNDSTSLQAHVTLGTKKSEGGIEIAKLPMKSLPFGNTAMLEGTLDGKLSFSGTPSNPRAELAMSLGGLQQNYPTMADLRDQELAITLRGSLQSQNLAATLSANASDSASTAKANVTLPVEVSLHPQSLRFAPKGTIAATLNADLMLAPFLPLFLPDGIYGTGRVKVDMTAKGALDSPNLQGNFALDSGRLEILEAGTVVSDIRLRATADGKRLTITEGSATDGGKGTLSLKGTLGLSPTLPMNIAVGIRHFVALRHSAAIATLSGDTTLKGDLSDAKSQGNWQIETAQIAIQPPGESKIPDLRVIEVTSLDAPVSSKSEKDNNGTPLTSAQRKLERPFSRNLRLNHAVKAENQIFLEGFGLNAELKGNMNITGTAARPKLAGAMQTLRGRWEFFGRTFTITRGEARLSEDNLAAPLIDIHAETQADDVTAIAQITGTTNNPKIEFTSVPSLPQDEILARVMFGRNLNSISPYQALQLADMLRSLRAGGGGTSINPLSKLQHTLGIDELKINNESGEETTVGVGKYLKENVYLEVEGGAGQDSGKVSIEVDLTPNVSVSTEARQTADSAVRLNYKYDY